MYCCPYCPAYLASAGMVTAHVISVHSHARPEPAEQDAGPLGSGHSPSASDGNVADSGGSVEDPSTHLIHGPASTHRPTEQEHKDI